MRSPFSAGSQFSAVPFSAGSQFSAVRFSGGSQLGAVPYPLVRSTSLVR